MSQTDVVLDVYEHKISGFETINDTDLDLNCGQKIDDKDYAA